MALIKIKNLGDLTKFVNELNSVYNPSKKIIFSDRFNDFIIEGEIDYVDDALSIPIAKVGSALQGSHRVLGKKKEEID